MWQGTVTPSRRRTPGSIPGSPTIFYPKSPDHRWCPEREIIAAPPPAREAGPLWIPSETGRLAHRPSDSDPDATTGPVPHAERAPQIFCLTVCSERVNSPTLHNFTIVTNFHSTTLQNNVSFPVTCWGIFSLRTILALRGCVLSDGRGAEGRSPLIGRNSCQTNLSRVVAC